MFITISEIHLAIRITLIGSIFLIFIALARHSPTWYFHYYNWRITKHLKKHGFEGLDKFDSLNRASFRVIILRYLKVNGDQPFTKHIYTEQEVSLVINLHSEVGLFENIGAFFKWACHTGQIQFLDYIENTYGLDFPRQTLHEAIYLAFTENCPNQAQVVVSWFGERGLLEGYTGLQRFWAINFEVLLCFHSYGVTLPQGAIEMALAEQELGVLEAKRKGTV